METRNKKLSKSRYLKNTESCTTSSEAPIHKLNDDCLTNIFMFLQIIDRIRIERVCKRWKAVSERSWQNVKILNVNEEIWGFDLYNKLDTEKIIIFVKVLERCGHFLRRLDFSLIYVSNNILHHVAKLCPNLQSIDVKNLKLTCPIVKALTKNCHNLIEISFGECTIGCNDSHLSKLLSQNKYLRLLKMTENRSLTGEFLLSLPKESIETIIILNCINISALHVNNALGRLEKLKTFSFVEGSVSRVHNFGIISSLPECLEVLVIPRNSDINTNSIIELTNLTKLDIFGLDDITDAFLIALAANCKQLSCLNISYCNKVSDKGMHAICRLPKMAVLYLESLNKITDQPLKHMSNLHKLICSECTKLKDDGLCTLIQNCETIEVLDLSFCPQITNLLVDCAIVATKSRTNGLVLNINLIGTSVRSRHCDINQTSPFLDVILPLQFENIFQEVEGDDEINEGRIFRRARRRRMICTIQ